MILRLSFWLVGVSLCCVHLPPPPPPMAPCSSSSRSVKACALYCWMKQQQNTELVKQADKARYQDKREIKVPNFINKYKAYCVIAIFSLYYDIFRQAHTDTHTHHLYHYSSPITKRQLLWVCPCVFFFSSIFIFISFHFTSRPMFFSFLVCRFLRCRFYLFLFHFFVQWYIVLIRLFLPMSFDNIDVVVVVFSVRFGLVRFRSISFCIQINL